MILNSHKNIVLRFGSLHFKTLLTLRYQTFSNLLSTWKIKWISKLLITKRYNLYTARFPIYSRIKPHYKTRFFLTSNTGKGSPLSLLNCRRYNIQVSQHNFRSLNNNSFQLFYCDSNYQRFSSISKLACSINLPNVRQLKREQV